MEFLGEIGFYKSLKNVINRPFWMANFHFYGLGYGEGKNGLCMGAIFFGGRIVQPRKASVATGEPANGVRYDGVDWNNGKFFTLDPGVNRALAMLFPVQV